VRLSGVTPELADPVGSLEVGEHQDVEQFGAGSGTERVQTGPEAAFELVRPHVRRPRRRRLERKQERLETVGWSSKVQRQ
jgi:hypothetical protein